jgi:hypothetical protein
MPSSLNVVGVNFMVNESLAHRYQDFLSKVRTAKFSIFILFLVIMQWNLLWYIHHPDLFKSRSFWPGSDPELYFWILNRFRPFLHKACTERVLREDWKLDPHYVPYGIFYPSHYGTLIYYHFLVPDWPDAGQSSIPRFTKTYTPESVHSGRPHAFGEKTPCTLKLLVVERHYARPYCWLWKDVYCTSILLVVERHLLYLHTVLYIWLLVVLKLAL